MWIVFKCHGCDARLEIDSASVGERVQCPTCAASVVVPRKGVEPDTTIGGFRIIRLIGRGGMGDVYLARQISMERLVALKILSTTLAAQPDAAEAFVREIRLTARLQHPHLVTAYDAGEDAGVLFMAMALIDGPSLHEYVRRRGALEQAPAVVIARKVAQALAYAWKDHQLLHRDVKPGNVLMDEKGEPHLADLGLSTTLRDASGVRSQGPLGTPNYMSPEQACGAAVDFRTDIYGLGATFYTMVTGQIPYEAGTPGETLARQAREPLPDPRIFNAELSEAFVDTLGRMLARDPSARFRSWDETVSALEKLEHPLPAASRGPAMPRKISPSVLWAGAATGLVVGLAGGGWMVYALNHRSRPEVPPPSVATNVVSPASAMSTETNREDSTPAVSVPNPKAIRPDSEVRARAEEFRRARLEQVRLRLQKDADQLVATGRTEEAIQRLRAYAGPMAAETRPFRLLAAQSLESQRAEALRMDRARESVARRLLSGQAAQALEDLDQAGLPPGEALTSLRTLVEGARDTDRAILESFRPDTGREIVVEFNDSRREIWRLERVKENVLVLRQYLDAGLVERELSSSELSLPERLRRLAGEGELRSLQRGLLAAQAGDFAVARAEWESVRDPLRTVLLRRIAEIETPAPLPDDPASPSR